VTLELTTDEGRVYRGRMAAIRIGEDARTGTEVYLRRSGEVIAYRVEERRYRTVEDPENELLDVLPTDQYIAAMDALGIVPVVDLDSLPVAEGSKAPTVRRPASTGGRNRLRSVPGDLVEPPVSWLKRVTGHAEATVEGPATMDESLPADLTPEASPDLELEPKASST